MIYAITIDWLSIHCHYKPADAANFAAWEPHDATDSTLFGEYPFKYRKADYGTRQFSRLYFVSMPNPEGGHDDFAEIQAEPHSGILNQASIIVRFVNRSLYTPDFWELAERLLSQNDFYFQGITRIDICADFNQFATYDPQSLILDFAGKKLRHVGRGVGALYFNHGVVKKQYGVNYTGLSFGTHASDVRVYLYNKSFELLTQGDKPWIRDLWRRIGLDQRNVWRLEVSIKSKGCKFKDKETGNQVTIDADAAKTDDELAKIYHTFRTKLFSFVKNHDHITNITREPRIVLFEDAPAYSRGCIRNVSAGNRLDKMMIKSLWLLSQTYRGSEPQDLQTIAQQLAMSIADATDLTSWLRDRFDQWDRPTHK